MKNEISNLVSISKNKFNINLLETIEHKQLFKNINNVTPKFNSSNIIDNNNNIQSQKIDSDTKNATKQFINKSKNNTKSFNDIIKNKLVNLQEIFNKYSPEKNKKFLTQNNSGKINISKKLKRNISTSLNKRIKNNKALLKNNLINFKFQRNTRNSKSKKKEYIPQSRNDGSKVNLFINFKKNSKKDNDNNLKYSFNINNTKNLTTTPTNNNNLDVYNRLYNRSYYKKKNDNVYPEEKDCTFNPKLLSQFETKEDINNFIKRQEKFNKYIKQKKINLNKDLSQTEGKKCTFTPNTSCTSGSKYSIKLEAQRQDESKLDKTNRMVYDQIKKIKDKKNDLFLMYNKKYTFIPLINKKINLKKIKNISLKNNHKIQKRKIISLENENDKVNKNNHKYINHQYDNVKSTYKNDKELMTRIKEENKKKKNKIDIMRKEQENSKFENYTFKPDIIKNNLSFMYNFNRDSKNIYYNKPLETEISYSNNYFKKKNFRNKINRSYSCYINNNSYISNNTNYIKHNKLENPTYYNYNNTEYENDIHDYNDYNFRISDNNCYNHFYTEKDINENNSGYYYDHNIYNNNYDEYNKSEQQCNDISRRNLSMGNDKGKYTYMYMTPNCNKIYKSRVVQSIKKEDKDNFLLIHKLLYGN